MKQLKTILQSIACIALLAGFNQANAATQLYFIHNDHLGTPQVITDQNQTVVWEGRQKPFGEVEVTTNTIDNDARFPGQYLDEESGLHYNYFRDYDPTIGRYIQSDPIGLEGGINTYAYVGGNPLSYIDPVGLDFFRFNNSGVTYVYERNTPRGKIPTGKTEFFPANSGFGEGLNNPSLQGQRDVGPIREGRYFIDISNGATPEKTSADGNGWGLYGWRLKESIFTNIDRRLTTDRDGGFFLHQDGYNGNTIGTAGCIGVTGDKNIMRINELLKQYSKKSNFIKVYVNYQ